MKPITLYLFLFALSGTIFSGSLQAHTTDLPGYDVILLVGQSNMVGYGTGPDNAADAAENPRVLQWDANNSTIIPAVDPLVQNQVPAYVGLGMTFAKAYLKTLPSNRQVLLVGAACGETSFVSGRWQAPNGDLAVTAVQRANAAMAAAGFGARFAGILWHQGEGDVAGLAADAYAANLDNLISFFRANIIGANGTTPFVVGEFAYQWITQNLSNSVYAPQQSKILNDFHTLPDSESFTAWVSGAGLPSDADPHIVHYNALSQRQFGRRYADKFFEAVNNLPQPEFSQKSWGGVFFDDGRSYWHISNAVTPPATVFGSVTAVTDPERGNVASIHDGQGWLQYTIPASAFDGSFTEMCWFQPNNSNYENYLISTILGSEVEYFSAMTVSSGLKISAGHSVGPAAVPEIQVTVPAFHNVWTNIAVVYDASSLTMSLYVNGAIVATQGNVSRPPILAGAAFLYVGSYDGGTGETGLDGNIAGSRLWSVALMPAQILAIYNYELNYRAGF